MDNKSKKQALKEAIDEGIESEIAYDFDPKKHLADLKAKKLSTNVTNRIIDK